MRLLDHMLAERMAYNLGWHKGFIAGMAAGGLFCGIVYWIFELVTR